MPLRRETVREMLRDFKVKRLFIEELGWDRPPTDALRVEVDGRRFELKPIANKRGMVVYEYDASDEDPLPDHTLRQKIERQVTRSAHEHIIVYCDAKRRTQLWQWVRREPGRPTASRQSTFHADQAGEGLIQKLENISFGLDEEESLTISTVARRAREAFDVERVTRRFYDQFRAEHTTFLKFIKGIQAQGDREWYASLMLNRLMFVYFIQKKGFLDADTQYLRNRLQAMRRQKGKDKFLSFYRHFLLRLFHEGLGDDTRSRELDQLLGRVPYMNGGLFDVHELERQYEDIQIPDDAFERLFDFFDRYNWHLDERPLRADDEINPDVLGYIFEKYINQKQMGAYYTKEDITGYMSANALVATLLGRVLDERGESVADDWSNLMREAPDRYIREALRYGIGEPLPAEVAPRSASSSAVLRSRSKWNQNAPDTYALVSETWRDVVSRRDRYERTRERLEAKGNTSVGDLLTLNVDLTQLAQDMIAGCESDALLRSFWRAVSDITVLDPACGSGAFLFAALNILEPLYEACLERMDAFQQEGERIEDFRSVLTQVGLHPNRKYYILKTIILRNLFGVDIMEEAVEICKLRLFLKLAAQVEPSMSSGNLGIEPLPDIDFNIRAGNSLVGFATYAEAEAVVTSKLDFDRTMQRVASKAEDLQSAFDIFRATQVEAGTRSVLTEQKAALRRQLSDLQGELDGYLAADYGVDPTKTAAYGAWRSTHQPFHWFVEFYGVMSGGGFDVIIGNPPYVEYSQVAKAYTILNPSVRSLGNLHAMMTRRSLQLLRSDGGMSMIVPVALPSTDRFEGLRTELLTGRNVWVSHYDFRPAKLFEGAEQRLTIFILLPADRGVVFSTRYNRWYANQRPFLFPCLAYTASTEAHALRPVWPKLDGELAGSILNKVASQPEEVARLLGRTSSSALYYKNTGILYHTTFTRKAPECFINGTRTPSSRETSLKPVDTKAQKALHCILNSSTFFVIYEMQSNCRDLNPSDIQTFRVSDAMISDAVFQKLSDDLHENQQANSRFRTRNQRLTGEVRLQSFQPALSKPVLDAIDLHLARHYGFTEEELDFIINYDIKYRLGAEMADEPDGAVAE